MCGLPSGVSAVFLPNPVAADTSDGISSAATGQSEVTLSVPYTVARSSYGLAFYASYKNVGGVTVGGIPGGGVDPQFAVLNVQANSVSLQPAAAIPADAGQGCSPIPAGYQPPLQPTPSPSSYALNTWVSDPHPAAGETVSVYAQLSLDGRPIGGAPITFTWYSFGVTRAPCYAVTDSSGTASCSVVNSYPLPGVPVSIQVSTNYNGYFLSSWTSYTM